MELKITKKELELLKDLEKRLVENYNNDTNFEQHEEDRLLIGELIDRAIKNERY